MNPTRQFTAPHAAVVQVLDANRIMAQICTANGVVTREVTLRLNGDLRYLFPGEELLRALESILSPCGTAQRMVKLRLRRYVTLKDGSALATPMLCFWTDQPKVREVNLSRMLFCALSRKVEFSLVKHWVTGVMFRVGQREVPLTCMLDSDERSLRNPAILVPSVDLLNAEVDLMLDRLKTRLTCSAQDLVELSQLVMAKAKELDRSDKTL
jgi:hypothetical protein